MKHGGSLTAWFAAFAVQAALVSANGTDVAVVLGGQLRSPR
jgi:hypothetical protein